LRLSPLARATALEALGLPSAAACSWYDRVDPYGMVDSTSQTRC
jgi:hypothetical protein